MNLRYDLSLNSFNKYVDLENYDGTLYGADRYAICSARKSKIPTPILFIRKAHEIKWRRRIKDSTCFL